MKILVGKYGIFVSLVPARANLSLKFTTVEPDPGGSNPLICIQPTDLNLVALFSNPNGNATEPANKITVGEKVAMSRTFENLAQRTLYGFYATAAVSTYDQVKPYGQLMEPILINGNHSKDERSNLGEFVNFDFQAKDPNNKVFHCPLKIEIL